MGASWENHRLNGQESKLLLCWLLRNILFTIVAENALWWWGRSPHQMLLIISYKVAPDHPPLISLCSRSTLHRTRRAASGRDKVFSFLFFSTYRTYVPGNRWKRGAFVTVCNMTASLRDLALSHLLIQYVHVFELFSRR